MLAHFDFIVLKFLPTYSTYFTKISFNFILILFLYFQIIAYDRRRGGTIVIDKRETETVTSLIISQADESDSGRYTCDPASSYPQSIIVHVTKGKISLLDNAPNYLVGCVIHKRRF